MHKKYMYMFEKRVKSVKRFFLKEIDLLFLNDFI